MEGASMTKYNGKYYLQYAASGTQFNFYGDGVYIGETPIGPFTYMKRRCKIFTSKRMIKIHRVPYDTL